MSERRDSEERRTESGERPRLAVTMGDVAGIGPEVVVRALLDERVHRWCRPVIVGDPEVLERAVHLVHADVEIAVVEGPEAAAERSGTLACWNSVDEGSLSALRSPLSAVPPATIDSRAGRAAYDWLVAAAQAARNGRVDAVTTAPLNKAALHRAGLHYPGHTEILAEVCGVERFAMMLWRAESQERKAESGEPDSGRWTRQRGLGVAHVTLHTSLASVPQLITTEAVRGRIELLAEFLTDLGCARPRIGVCALNPHAGEEGAFGDEETRIIAPAVTQARDSGIAADGPHPADTLLKRAVAGEFDGVVAMYHDQGHIALKLVGFERAVNVTLGLPFVRTSPSHGTAFDIAWRGTVRADGMIEAIRVASTLATAGG